MFPFSAVYKLVPWDFYLILIALATLVPWRGLVRVKLLLDQPMPSAGARLSLYKSTIFYQWLLVAGVAWRAFARNLGRVELGLVTADPRRTISVAVVLTAVLCGNQFVSLKRITGVPASERGLLFRIADKITPRASREMIFLIALSWTAGISEEFLYRGFVFAAFARLFSNLRGRVSLQLRYHLRGSVLGISIRGGVEL